MAAFNTSIRAGLGSSMGPLGSKAGTDYGLGLGRGVKTGMGNVAATVKAQSDAAAAAVRDASAKVAAARDVEAKAAGNVRVAELKLQEVRDRASASASQVAAAEERLATAERAAGVAAEKTAVASRELGAAQFESANASEEAGVKITTMSDRAMIAGAKVRESMAGAGKAIMGLGVLGAGIGAADFLVKGVQNATKFQKSMNLLVTAGGEAKSAMGLVSSGIEGIATQTGTSLDQLSEGMYTVEKAGLRGADGLKVLRAAAEGAKDENVDLSTMTNALTSVMRSYNLPASAAVKTMNEMIAASGASKTSMAGFAGALSTVMPLASAAHLSFAQIGGAIATLTSHGTSADEATQELSNTIRNLVAPNRVAVNEMAQFGIQSNLVATQIGKKGLQGTLEELSQTVLQRMGPAGTVLLKAFNQSKVAAGDASQMYASMNSRFGTYVDNYSEAGTIFTITLSKLMSEIKDGTISSKDYLAAISGLSPTMKSQVQQFVVTQNKAQGFNSELRAGGNAAQTYNEAIKKMTGGATGLTTTLMLTGGSAHTFTDAVNAIATAGQHAGANITAWASTQKTFSVQMDRFRESVQVAGVQIGAQLLPPLTKFVTTVANGVIGLDSFVSKNSAWIKPVAAGLGILAGALGAVVVGVKAWTLAQTALDVVMNANPIGVVITAVVGLGLALVVVYKNSQTFRDVVHDAMHDVVVAVQAVGAAGTWLWKNALLPAFNGVSAVVKDAWNSVIHPVFTAINSFVRNDLGPTITWLWKTIIQPAFQAEAAYIKWWWNTVSAIFDLAVNIIRRTLGPAFTWLWTEVVRPTFTSIGNFIQNTWTNVLRPTFTAVDNFLRNTVGPVFTWLWRNAIQPQLQNIAAGASALWNKGIKPAFQGIASTVQAVWKNIIQPVFNTLSTAIRTDIPAAFRVGVAAIGKAWSTVQAVAEAPVRFVVETVLNNGLIAAFNWVAGKVGSKSISPIPLPKGFATGGQISGPGGPTDDQVPIWASPGEYMVNARSAKKHHQLIEAINGDRLPGFSLGGDIGGIWNSIKGAAGDIWSAITNPVDLLKKLAGSALGKLGSIQGNALGDMAAAVPGDLLTMMAAKVKSWLSLKPKPVGGIPGGLPSGSGSASVRAEQAYALSLFPAFGWPASDMPSLINLWNGESGWNPRAYNATSGATGIPQSLPASKMASAGADYMTNPDTQIRWGLGYIKSAYGDPATTYAKWLSREPHWYDQGGYLQPGTSMVRNDTGKPEPVFSADQWSTLRAAALPDRNGSPGGETHYHTHIEPRTSNIDLAELQAYDQRKAVLARIGRRS